MPIVTITKGYNNPKMSVNGNANNLSDLLGNNLKIFFGKYSAVTSISMVETKVENNKIISREDV